MNREATARASPPGPAPWGGVGCETSVRGLGPLSWESQGRVWRSRRGEGCSLAPEQRERGASGAQNKWGSGGWKEPLKVDQVTVSLPSSRPLGPQSVARYGNRVFAQSG